MEQAPIPFDSALYPSLLADITNAPKILYAKGNAQVLAFDSIAIVGTRKASPQGLEFTQALACELARAGLVIVSGLAQGIDGAAHKGALEGSGKTIAVLASSLEEKFWFPRAHTKLANEIIAKGGALVSEYERDTPARKAHFVQRNRIVSGLSLGVIVVESPIKGGSLITANFALSQKRALFAVPGFPLLPNAKGPNGLIKKGAFLIENAADALAILEEKRLFSRQKQRTVLAQGTVTLLDKNEERILQALGQGITTIDKLAQKTKVEVGTLMSFLTAMEMKGLVNSTGSGIYRLSNNN